MGWRHAYRTTDILHRQGQLMSARCRTECQALGFTLWHYLSAIEHPGDALYIRPEHRIDTERLRLTRDE